jgi:glycogen debranching enzyme
MPQKTIDIARDKAVEVLKTCAKPAGFYASGLKGGYEAVWARDSMITSLGACLAGDEFKNTFKNSLELLEKHQSDNGLIPNCVGSYNTERQSDITFNSIDAPQWFIIGHYVYAGAYKDDKFLAKSKTGISKALNWLKYQDPNEDKLIVQQPTMDWMDAFPHKYGRVIHTQALQYAVLKFTGQNESADYIKRIINGETQKYLSLFDKSLGYYRPWIWKDHDGDRESEDWFDAAGNLLAIVSGLASPAITKSILNFIEKNQINRPYPVKAIWPPLKPGDKNWHSYFSKCDAREPYDYLNAGIWPFIGGLYAAALVKAGQIKKAENELDNLAAGCLERSKIRNLSGEYEFNEWLHGQTGQALGEPYQGWTAGMYIYAYECVKAKKVLFFNA